MNAERLVEDKQLREQLVSRTDVLDKVKVLTLLPDGIHMTVRQIAEYYEVDIDSVRKVIQRHRDELESDGMKSLAGQEFKEYKETLGRNVSELKQLPSSNLLPRRAILRVGMLLRDSKVAKKVRTYLLNVEQEATFEQKSLRILVTSVMSK